ncbi:putative bifunctional diguanylate cyclase/phosphodiesterase [Paenibacillus glufosinatiresistens]|uniref:putative bifunctional diguanylate cyclase/phosphodiesterase n=1 Tax=Paenibacillus glufosinatiresistens TaxID=3070657 RepID=UPI00286DAA8C|nr:EAL domain-containing protein [Paenibacillus sp. YX.27]
MEQLPEVMSTLYVVAYAFCLFLGIYTFAASVNRMLGFLCLVLSLSLCIWAFACAAGLPALEFGSVHFRRVLSILGLGVCYTLASLLMIRLRRSRVTAQRERRLLLLAAAPALGLALLTDELLRLAPPGPMARLAGLVPMLPYLLVLAAVRRNGMLRQTEPEDEEILSGAGTLGLYNRLALLAVAAGILHAVVPYFVSGPGPAPAALRFSALLLLLGALIRLIGQLRFNSAAKLYMSLALFVLVIPAVTLNFQREAALNVWAFPLALMLFALVFRRRLLLVALTLTAVLTQSALWLWVPRTAVEVGAGDYLARIGIFAMCFVIAYYVHRTYVYRLRHNERQLQLQKLMTEISSDFAAAGRGGIEQAAHRTLEALGRHFELDRVVIFRKDREDGGATSLWEWHRRDLVPLRPFLPHLTRSRLEWWFERMKDGGAAIIDVHDLPDEPPVQKDKLHAEGTASVAMLPIPGQKEWLGCMGLAAGKPGILRDSLSDFLTIMANLFSGALKRMDSEEEADQLAFYDYLTGLPNRILFRRRAEEVLSREQARGGMAAVLFVDLDSFKNINDTLGHEAGDELLVCVAREMQAALGRSCMLSRFGGDEFLVLAHGIRDKGEAIGAAERLMAAFRRPVRLQEQKFYITASAGVALYPADGRDAETLVKNADIAMFRAKESGKNQYRFCSAAMKEEVSERLSVANSLAGALERGELRLLYQPQLSLHSGRIIGMEALIRWKRPGIGSVPPQLFIPIAESTGLISAIGDWVLRTACEQNKTWQDLGLPRVRMAVNISVHQLRDPGFASKVTGTLAATGLDPEDLELEVTESGAIREQDQIVQVLGEIKQKGVSISIDDFGTEYSSLSRLKQLPVDKVKLDMEFVHGIEESPKDQAITRGMISLARNLGLKVVAEGVETQAQLDFLESRMCDEVQGYYYYRPLSAEEMEEVLRTAAAGEREPDRRVIGPR